MRQNSNSLAPFIPTPYNIVRKMLEFAQLKKSEVLFDLGSGDGRIVLMAAKDFGAKSIGVEHRLSLVEEAREKAIELDITNSTLFLHDNIFNVNLKTANVVTLYLTIKSNERIRHKLEKELHNGARVVTHNFPMIKWIQSDVMKIIEDHQIHTLYLYNFTSRE
ncbi:SAM-dependent methyltransferase [Candidatus Bathyarchaeota archaeon]|nr:SAM-dependent methyltransferase [Candidatus Bathyarchaeota archaeon]